MSNREWRRHRTKKMDKLLKYLMLMVIATFSLTFVSCGDDDDTKLSGLYVDESYQWSNTAHAYYFQNKNTVLFIPFAHKGSTPDDEFYGRPIREIENTGWYEVEGHPTVTYTYSIKDNKVFIPMDGVILTISDGRLYQEGSSSFFTKVK